MCGRYTLFADRVADVVGSVPDERMEEVGDAFEYSLGLARPAG